MERSVLMIMRRLLKYCILVLVALVIFCGVMTLCPGLKDFWLNLPNGYQLVQTSNECTMVTDHESSVLIDANVDGYQVVKHLVIGHVSRTSWAPIDGHQETPGYFILNTKNGKFQRGLTKKKCQSVLGNDDIDTELRLESPNIVRAWLSKIGA